jgi:Arylsulfotransferase (ASST)
VVGFAIAAGGCGGANEAALGPKFQRFASRPDLQPPPIKIDVSTKAAAPGYVFIAPKKDVRQEGPLILDGRGRVIWFRPSRLGVADFRVQRYRGRPVLTWWQGHSEFGRGRGNYVILNSAYRRIAVVRAGNGLAGDEHEFTITPRGTALITFYDQQGDLVDSGFQEIDIATNRVRFEWRALGHITLSESYAERQGSAPFDYFHINSVALGRDANFLISARNTHAVYDIDRRTGAVVWRLGGKRSDFEMGRGTTFAWQHDAQWRGPTTISIFDDGARPAVEKQSRALLLRVDLRQRKVRLMRAYAHPRHLLSTSQGNMQVLPDRHVFVGWGSEPTFTEFARDGRVVFDGHFVKGADSYRGYKFVWNGRPKAPPVVAVRRAGSGLLTVYASWNGATSVSRWQVLAGATAAALKPAATAGRTGFETAIKLRTKAKFVAVRALMASGPPGPRSPTVPAR